MLCQYIETITRMLENQQLGFYASARVADISVAM
jgi:phage gp37-like protein